MSSTVELPPELHAKFIKELIINIKKKKFLKFRNFIRELKPVIFKLILLVYLVDFLD
jgi:hypothetical protein